MRADDLRIPVPPAPEGQTQWRIGDRLYDLDGYPLIDFEKLLPVVRELDAIRFRGSVVNRRARWLSATKMFATLTHDRMLPPKPFVFDGCTLSPDAFGKDCCELHDLAYWLGGSRRERLAADQRLRECTRKRSRVYAAIQYLGVRLFGGPRTPDHLVGREFRWGFGWDYPQAGEPGTEY